MRHPGARGAALPVLYRVLSFAGAAAVLAGVFALYLDPDFMVTLAQQLWACF